MREKAGETHLWCVGNNALVALTEERYWSEIWSSSQRAGDSIKPGKAEYLEQEYHRFFAAALAGRSGSLLEVGCGSSQWMAYFARNFGYHVSGIDYSPLGCSQASEILRKAGVSGEVSCRDALSENYDLWERFDVVISLGLIEHFADTAEIARSLTRYVKPGGLLISTSPNMAGILGFAQRVLNRPVYEGHVPFTLEQLAEAHRRAGLVVERADYLGGLDFHGLNLMGTSSRVKWLSSRLLMRLSRIGWRAPFSAPRGRRWASALAVIAVKPSP